MRVVIRTATLVGLAAVVFAVGCRKQEEPQDAQYPQGAYPQQQYPQQQYPQQQYPQQQYPQQQSPPASNYPTQPTGAAPPPPAGGVPCQTDNDPQCPFGHCINGSCGPCSVAEHCKPNATCMQTPLGMACVPAGMPGATPTQ